MESERYGLMHCYVLTPLYRNYRGETSRRTIEPRSIRYGTSQWHREPQWLMSAYDRDKGEIREFAMRDMWFDDQPGKPDGR